MTADNGLLLYNSKPEQSSAERCFHNLETRQKPNLKPDTTMQKSAFKMKLKPGCEAEYERRHNELWPEMRQKLRRDGVGNYSIFFDPDTLALFAYQELSGGISSQQMGDDPVIRKWWDYMADIMEVNPDNSPVSIPLRQVFHFE